MSDVLIRSYQQALAALEATGPEGIEEVASLLARKSPQVDVSLTALCDFLQQTGPDEPLRIRLHLALARWDGEVAPDWAGDSKPNTLERRYAAYGALGFNSDVAHVFDAVFPTTGPGTIVISEDFEPWYTPQRRAERELYWTDYAKHLLSNKWDGDALAKLDVATSQVVERLSDPTRAQAFQSKGLVVGYVQSGKTANFTGVIAKAVDAGYRLVIVLTGTIDLLRQQTQRRLDMELVGLENIYRGVDPDDDELASKIDYYDDPDRIEGKFLAHGFLPSEQGYPDIIRLTTHAKDYRGLKAGITALEHEKRDKRKPLFDPENLFVSGARLAVVKKNASVLKKLVGDLRSIATHLGEIPALIIDDESDQASVNTSDPQKWQQGKRDRTAINELIAQLLGLLPRAQYVGYTATPYANVFIDPDDGEDIFPKDFLISLERPPGYVGVEDFHDLEFVGDVKTVETSKEKSFVRDLVKSGPASDAELRQAIDMYVLSGALKLYRRSALGDDKLFKHHTMLVHESVRMVDHAALAQRIAGLWDASGFVVPTGLSRLEALFEDDFRRVSLARASSLPFPTTFADLKPFIGQAVSKIAEGGTPVLVVNGDKDIAKEELDFDKRAIWRMLVGGAKLSRGFTVEGLTVSYYRRKTKQADTLMQMGRWFGFRKNYHDLVRLHIGRMEPDGRSTIDLYEAFEAIMRDEEAFRSQLRQYSVLVDGKPQIRPRDIPPLVSQHLPAIMPSARNKMFNAELVIRRSPGLPMEPTGYTKDRGGLKENYEKLLPILAAAQESLTFAIPEGGSFDALVGIVAADMVANATRDLKWVRDGYFAPDQAYLEEISKNEQLKDWVVIAPQVASGMRVLPNLGRRSTFERKRRRDPLFGAISDPKHRGPARRIAGTLSAYGDPHVEKFVKPYRGAILMYPVLDMSSGVAPIADPLVPADVVMAFVSFAPLAARPTNGQVVQFRARRSDMSSSAVVTGGAD